MNGKDEAADSRARIVSLVASDDAAAGALREQYEVFPYPPRRAEAEADRLITGSPSHYMEIDHFVFAGRRDWSKPFRALVAGGGTGDAAIMLGQHLNDIGCPAEIVHLDISEASRVIARRRAEQRALTNISFVHASLLDLPGMDIAPFDYIDCCGVLHHLTDPAAGLRALRAVLQPDGGMGLMLYGTLGRAGIYDVQDIMRGVTRAGEDQAAQLPLLRSLLGQLPASNRLVRNQTISHSPGQSDAELVDKFLHSQDRAYTVREVIALCADAGMRIAAFAPTGRYDPLTYITDDTLRERLRDLDRDESAALAELIAGNMARHIFYAVHADNPADTVARHVTADAIPVLRQDDGPVLAQHLTSDMAFHAPFDELTIVATPPPLAANIMRRIDGKSSLEDIYFDLVGEVPGLDWTRFLAQFRELHGAMHGLLNAQYLRYPA